MTGICPVCCKADPWKPSRCHNHDCPDWRLRAHRSGGLVSDLPERDSGKGLARLSLFLSIVAVLLSLFALYEVQ